jgi:hypothetical protein
VEIGLAPRMGLRYLSPNLGSGVFLRRRETQCFAVDPSSLVRLPSALARREEKRACGRLLPDVREVVAGAVRALPFLMAPATRSQLLQTRDPNP